MDTPKVSLGMKSTNVRVIVARLFFKVLVAISPALASRLLARLFLTARRFQTPPREQSWLAGSERFEVESGVHRIAVWARGEGPVVLLAHGWEGRGSQMAAFLDPLVTAGFRVVTFDAPGHGRSTGRTSSLVEMADAVLDVGRAVGPLAAVIAHSAGTAATTIALSRGLAAQRLIYLAPPSNPGDFLAVVAALLGIPISVARGAQERIEKRFDVRWDAISSVALAPRMTLPLVAIHDRDDQEVPWSHAQRLTEIWPGAQLISTQGLGHRRILRDPGVVTTVVRELGLAFLAQERIPA